jgi:peptidoglycan/LPS O-acetylase OafA/YrhL
MNAPRVKHRLAVLDGLRGLAIVLVVWFHLWQISWLRADVPFTDPPLNLNLIPEGGFVGVDLFFFISGFALFYPYAQTLFDGRPLQTLQTFVMRRVQKILPSYVVVMAVLIAIGMSGISSFRDGFRAVALHLLFVHTWFPDTYGAINGVLWSLGVEVQFYVIFPLLCWAAMRAPVPTFVLMAVVANTYRFAVLHHYDVGNWYDQLPGVLDLFGAGMLGAYLYRAIAVRAPRLAGQRMLWTLVAWGGIALFFVVLNAAYQVRYDPNWPWETFTWGRGTMCLAFLMTTVGSLFGFTLWQRVLGNPVLVFLSVISYNLYLWHQPVARFLREHHIPPWHGADEHSDPAWGLPYSLIALPAMLVVATAFTYGLERPILFWRRKHVDETALARSAIGSALELTPGPGHLS